MPNEMQMNPDYQLVMTFLQNIRPGDMDEESAKQLMAIGQRIQGGGVLTDREREMFTSVVGATDRFPVEQMDTFPQGTNPDIMKKPDMGPAQSDLMDIIQRKESGGQMTEFEENRALEILSRMKGKAGMTELEFEDMKRRILEPMAPMADAPMAGMMPDAPMAPMAGRPPIPGKAGMAPSGDMAPSNVMGLQEAIDAGFVTVNRPQTRPSAPMTSMRPQTRRTQ